MILPFGWKYVYLTNLGFAEETALHNVDTRNFVSFQPPPE